ncbi:MAG: DUF2085 domain-containing protein [Chloroflexota bacterium]
MLQRNWAAQHWVPLVTLAAWIFALLPVLAPVLITLGVVAPAEHIYDLYSLVCHQWAHRSFFIFGAQPTYELSEIAGLIPGADPRGFLGSPETGYKLAYCERDLAIYLAIALTGTVYGLQRSRISALSPMGFALLLLPIAFDGFTQIFGWRESTPLLRILTGICFGLSMVWFVYPRLDALAARRQSLLVGQLS